MVWDPGQSKLESQESPSTLRVTKQRKIHSEGSSLRDKHTQNVGNCTVSTDLVTEPGADRVGVAGVVVHAPRDQTDINTLDMFMIMR